MEASITQLTGSYAGELHGAIDFMSSLVRVTIRVSLVLGLSLSNAGLAFAGGEACLPQDQLNSNICSKSSVFAPQTKEYDPGDTGNPDGGDGAGSR